MKAIVLAAGKGERLKGISKKTPKPMLKINDEIILEHNLKWLKQYGVTDIYINLYHLPEQIRGYFQGGQKLGVDISYFYEKEILGTSGAVKNIASSWKEEFLVVYGDNFFPFSYNLNKFKAFHDNNNALGTIGLYKKQSEAWKSGVVVIDNHNIVVDFIEKPIIEKDKHNVALTAESALINTGLYLFNSKISDYIPSGFSDFGKDIFPKLIRQKSLFYGYIFDDPLIAIDTIELYKKQQNINKGAQ